MYVLQIFGMLGFVCFANNLCNIGFACVSTEQGTWVCSKTDLRIQFLKIELWSNRDRGSYVFDLWKIIGQYVFELVLE